MKKTLSLFALILFALSTQAQKADDCPALEWVQAQDLQNDGYAYYPMHIDSTNNILYAAGFYNKNVQNVAGLPVPTITLPYQNVHTFLIKTDLAGNGKWILPFEIVKGKNIVEDYNVGIGSNTLDEKGNIHIIVVNHGWSEFNFAGNDYGDIDERESFYYFKVSPNGTLLSEYKFKDSILPGTTYQSAGRILKATDSSFLYTSALATPNQSNNKTTYLIKLNEQFEVDWYRRLETQQLFSFKERKDGEIYLFGELGHNLDADSIKINNTWLKLSEGNKYGTYYTKLDFRLGSFSESTLLMESELRHLFYGQDYRLVRYQSNYMTNGGNSYATVDSSANIYGIIALNNDISFPGVNKKLLYTNSNLHTSLIYRYNLITKDLTLLKMNGLDFMSSAMTTGGWGELKYLEKSKQLLLSGIFVGSVNFGMGMDSIVPKKTTELNTFLMSIDSDFGQTSEVAEWAKAMKPNWVIHSGSVSDGAQFRSLSDVDENIFLVGGLRKNYNHLDWAVLPDTKSSSYHAKLTALNPTFGYTPQGLMAIQDHAQYQWLDCSKGMQEIPGATGRFFKPAIPKQNYALRVSNSWCSVTSDCASGINQTNSLSAVQLYPNPVNNILHLSNLPIGVAIAVYDVLGRKVYAASVQQSSLKINTEFWSQGVYLVQLNYQGERWMSKVAK